MEYIIGFLIIVVAYLGLDAFVWWKRNKNDNNSNPSR